jgi:hypothetical protein
MQIRLTSYTLISGHEASKRNIFQRRLNYSLLNNVIFVHELHFNSKIALKVIDMIKKQIKVLFY